MEVEIIDVITKLLSFFVDYVANEIKKSLLKEIVEEK